MKQFIHNSEMVYISIEEMDFTNRTYSVLKRAGLNSLGELSSKNLDDLMNVRNLGRKSLYEIEEKLKSYGITLVPEQKKRISPESILEEHSYKYFISYAYTNKPGDIQFGNTEATSQKKINSISDIHEISEAIASSLNMNSITILSYTPFI